MAVLPGHGITRVPRNSDALQEELQSKLTRFSVWNPTSDSELFPDFLAGTLKFPDARPDYLTHYLNQWSRKGHELWVWVPGHELTDQQLNSLLTYNPVSSADSYALRIILELDLEQLNARQELAHLRTELQQRDTRIHQMGMSPDRYIKPVSVLLSVLLVIGLAAFVFQSLPDALKFPTLTNKPSETFLQNQNNAAPSNDGQDDRVAPDAGTPEVLTVANPFSDRQIEASIPAEKSSGSVMSEGAEGNAQTVMGADSVEDAKPEDRWQTTESEELETKRFVQTWLEAWANQNIGLYLQSYDDLYTLNKSMTPKSWRIWRTNRLKKPLWIRIEPGPITITKLSESSYLAAFWQLYRSPGYQDNTLKELEIVRTDQGLKIVRETNKDVRLVQD